MGCFVVRGRGDGGVFVKVDDSFWWRIVVVRFFGENEELFTICLGWVNSGGVRRLIVWLVNKMIKSHIIGIVKSLQTNCYNICYLFSFI